MRQVVVTVGRAGTSGQVGAAAPPMNARDKMNWRSMDRKNRKITQPTKLGYHARIRSSLIMRLNCGNALKSPEACTFERGVHEEFPQVIRSARARL
jgi:hypothetical protein